jgi:hypothetical protein
MEIVLRSQTPEGVSVVLPAIVYAKILQEHVAVADLDVIDRTIREPHERRRMHGRAVSGSSAAMPSLGPRRG